MSVITIFVHPGRNFMVRSRISAFGNVQTLNTDDIGENMAIKLAFLFTLSLGYDSDTGSQLFSALAIYETPPSTS